MTNVVNFVNQGNLGFEGQSIAQWRENLARKVYVFPLIFFYSSHKLLF